MTGIYDRAQDTATRLLTKFDQGVTLKVTTTTTGPNAWTPGTATTASHTLRGTVRGVSTRMIDGVNIIEGDMMVTVAVPSGVTPAIDHKVTFGGVDHAIMNIEPIPAAGTPAAFRMRVRK